MSLGDPVVAAGTRKRGSPERHPVAAGRPPPTPSELVDARARLVDKP